MFDFKDPLETLYNSYDMVQIDLKLEEYDLTSLFIKWLNTLLAESDINSCAFFEFKVKINDLKLDGKAFGIPRDRVDFGVEVKGATFSEAKVEKCNDMWIAQCVVDV